MAVARAGKRHVAAHLLGERQKGSVYKKCELAGIKAGGIGPERARARTGGTAAPAGHAKGADFVPLLPLSPSPPPPPLSAIRRRRRRRMAHCLDLFRGPARQAPEVKDTMRPAMVVFAAIPAVFAAMIAVQLAMQDEVPASAAGPSDRISVEYTKHALARIVHGGGVAERIRAERTEILSVSDDGALKYVLVEAGSPGPEISGMLDEAGRKRLAAMVKETGFAAIGSEFKAAPNATRYEQYSVKVVVNGAESRVVWPEPRATASFIPPIVTAVGGELDMIMGNLSAGTRYK